MQPISFTVETGQPAACRNAQLGNPDMRTPIAQALAWPDRVDAGVASLDLAHIGSLHFSPPDAERFPCLGLAYAALNFNKGDDPKALEAEVRRILRDVARNGVPEELVAAAKLQERSEAQFQRNSIPELASIWADALALYGLQSPDEDLARMERVTVADVNRVARKYLDLNHAVVGVMLPRGSGQPVPTRGGFGGQESITLGEAHATALPAWAEKALRRWKCRPQRCIPSWPAAQRTLR